MKKSVKRLMSCVLAMLFLVGTVFGNAGTLTAEASGDGGGTTYSGRIVYHLTDGKEDAGTGQEGTQEDTGEPVEGGELSEGGEGQEIPTDVTSEETGKTIEQAYSFVWDGVDEDLEAALKSAAENGTFSLKKVNSVLDEYPEIKNEGYVAAGWKVKKVNPESGEENNKVIRNAWDIPAGLYRENQGGMIELELAWGKAADVIYYMNDGTEASYTSPAIAGEKYAVSGFEDIAGAAGFQTPENMEFTGWNTSWDGTGENYAAGSEVTLNEGGLVLYAQWQDTGAAGTEDTGTTEPVTEPQTSDDGTGSTELGTEPQTEPDGGTGSTEPGTENGWEPQTEPSNVGSPLGNGLPDFHTITFDGNGATYNVPEAVKALLADGVYTTTIPDVTPELEGYSFNGWRDDEWNYYNPGAPVTVSTDVTLYADWTKTWKVTFEGNGQTGRNVPEPIIVREGDSLTLDETIPVPERDSYIFEGWSYNDTLYNTWDTIENITSDITLMASWKAVPVEFSITFDGQGATEGVPGNDSVEEGNPYTIPSDVPEKAGYIFKGWSDGQNVYAAGTDITDIKGNITLTAVWKGYYSITFDGQGATGGVVPQGASVEEGNSYTIPTEVPEKTGYTFKGWSDGQNTYNAGAELTNIAGNITFTAIWEAKAPEHVPVVPDPANSTVSGIKSGSVFTVGDKPSFEVKGAGMDNNAPGKGDVRYVPSDWTAGNNTATWQNGPYKGTLDLGKGDYTLQINLKKQVYDGAQWTADGTTASIKINFTIKEKETEALPETKTVSLSSGQTVISADDMNKLIADNAKQNIVINNGSVSFTFLKGTMQAVEGVTNYDFGTSLNSGTNYEKAKSLAGKQFVEFIHFNHDGQLPGKAIIRFPLDQAHAGALCYYYYYNPEKEGFTLVQEVTIGSDGYGQIEQEHCSDYVLTDSKLLKTIQGVTQISNPTNVPKTGDNTQIIIWIVILAVALVCIVIVGVIFVRKRKK